MAQLTASVLVIGDEILGGFVQDTNSGWLAQRLHLLGVPLERVVTVPDDVDAIGEALRTELARARPRVVLTSGGIGSTPDDLTLDAVARCLGLPLTVQPEIARRIERALAWSAEREMHMSDSQARSLRKMALVPEGAYLLAGGEGFVPGIAVDVDGGSRSAGGATVVILPGVPRELQRITVEGVEPELLAGRGDPLHVGELLHPYPESALNPVFDEIVAQFPDVHLGSYPGRECTVRLKGRRDRVEAALALVRAHLAELDAHPAASQLRTSWQARWG